jgi:hypothetical protein
MATRRQIQHRYQRATAHVKGWFEVASVLFRYVGGYAGIVVGTLKLLLPNAFSEIVLHPAALIAAGALLVGGKGALEQFDVLYRNIKT